MPQNDQGGNIRLLPEQLPTAIALFETARDDMLSATGEVEGGGASAGQGRGEPVGRRGDDERGRWRRRRSSTSSCSGATWT